MTKILIATPAFGGNVCSSYTESLIHTSLLLLKNNIDFEIKFINNQIVTRARNMLSHIFMNNDSFTHMLFIDADIVWTPTDVLKLIENDLECVIGVYANKGYIWQHDKLVVNPSSVFNNMNNIEPPNENLVSISKAATGFMLLTKAALTRIQNDVDTFFLPNDDGKELSQLYNYFDCNVVNNNYLTEDYYFSYLFIKNGGHIYADKRIVLGHIGSHIYGSLIKS